MYFYEKAPYFSTKQQKIEEHNCIGDTTGAI